MPTLLLMKFFARDKSVRLVECLIIWIAPSDFKLFSSIFNILRVLFYDNAIPMHSPPSDPKSLSSNEID